MVYDEIKETRYTQMVAGCRQMCAFKSKNNDSLSFCTP